MLAILVAFMTLVGSIIYFRNESIKQSTNLKLELEQLDKTQAQKDLELKKKIESQDQTIQQLQKDVQARAEARQRSLVAKVVNYIVEPVNASTAAPTLPTNDYKLYIYNHESGNNPTRWNSSGCLGLGQACPASKLLAVCPTMDYACEDQWFTNYALTRYGSWQGAYNFWLANRWW